MPQHIVVSICAVLHDPLVQYAASLERCIYPTHCYFWHCGSTMHEGCQWVLHWYLEDELVTWWVDVGQSVRSTSVIEFVLFIVAFIIIQSYCINVIQLYRNIFMIIKVWIKTKYVGVVFVLVLVETSCVRVVSFPILSISKVGSILFLTILISPKCNVSKWNHPISSCYQNHLPHNKQLHFHTELHIVGSASTFPLVTLLYADCKGWGHMHWQSPTYNWCCFCKHKNANRQSDFSHWSYC